MCVILPKKVPRKKVFNGIPTIGEAMLTNQFGTSGVSLKNNIYQNKFPCCFETYTEIFNFSHTKILTIPLNFFMRSGKNFITSPFPNKFDNE